MRQSRSSFASANVDFATGPRSPMLYNFEGCDPRHASISRRLSRYVICANAIARKCSVQRSVRTPISPPYFTTMRSKLVQGTKSITCEKRVRPEYMTVPRLKSQNRVRNYRQNLKPCSSRHQKKHPRNPYVAALFYKITLVEPDSTDLMPTSITKSAVVPCCYHLG